MIHLYPYLQVAWPWPWCDWNGSEKRSRWNHQKCRTGCCRTGTGRKQLRGWGKCASCPQPQVCLESWRNVPVSTICKPSPGESPRSREWLHLYRICGDSSKHVEAVRRCLPKPPKVYRWCRRCGGLRVADPKLLGRCPWREGLPHG